MNVTMISYPNVKINLGLNVLRKRQDGFHDLETLFLPCHALNDVLEIVSGDDYSRTSSCLFSKYGPAGDTYGEDASHELLQGLSEDGKLMITIARKGGVDWNPLQDLCARAYKELDADFDLPPVKIFLEKLSPVGAGLGGGSSDAAFAVRMLNEMFSLSLSDEKMAGYASRLGSDCAFFIYGQPMFGEGRGEVLSSFFPEGLSFETVEKSDYIVAADDRRYELKVIVPEGVAVSTADAYRGIVPSVPSVPLKEVLSRPVGEWKDLLVNDFEKTVFQKYPMLEKMKSSLYEAGAVYASMSGSGSAFFALFEV